MSSTPELRRLARQAAVVLSKRLKQAVTLVEPQLIKDKTRSVIVRCAVKSAGSMVSVPASVIIKQIRDDDDVPPFSAGTSDCLPSRP